MSNENIVPGFDNEVCDSLEIKLQKADLVLSFTGSIDAYNSECLKRRIMMVIALGFVKLCFILNGLDSISSTGVATFISLQKAVAEHGGEIIMVNVPRKIKDVFELLCLQSFFRCVDTSDPEK